MFGLKPQVEIFQTVCKFTKSDLENEKHLQSRLTSAPEVEGLM